MSDFQKPVKVKTALNNNKLALSAPCPTAKGKRSTLGFDFTNNNPSIVVRTNDPADITPATNYGTISAKMDLPIFFAFLATLNEVIESAGEIKKKIETYGHEYVNGQKSEDIKHQSDLWVGKDREGCPYMSVVSKDSTRPVIKFIFGPNDDRWVKFIHSDGTPYSKAEFACVFARAFRALLTQIVTGVAVTNYVPPVPRQDFKSKSNNGGARSYGGGGGGKPYGGNYGKANTIVEEDDLPF